MHLKINFDFFLINIWLPQSVEQTVLHKAHIDYHSPFYRTRYIFWQGRDHPPSRQLSYVSVTNWHHISLHLLVYLLCHFLKYKEKINKPFLKMALHMRYTVNSSFNQLCIFFSPSFIFVLCSFSGVFFIKKTDLCVNLSNICFQWIFLHKYLFDSVVWDNLKPILSI